MKRFFSLPAAIAGVAMLAGCLAPTQTVIEELDPESATVIRRTTVSESVVKTVVDSTKDKWVLISRQGWAGGIRAIPPGSSAENPAGCLEIAAGKEDSILSTMPMHKITPEAAATVMAKFFDVVGAARAGTLEFSATGISAGREKEQ